VSNFPATQRQLSHPFPFPNLFHAILLCPEGSHDCLQVYFRLFKHDKRLVLFRRRDIKAVQDTRVFRGADIESDHRLMVCKLRLKFRKPAKHTSILAYSLLPFTVKQARKHSSYPCRACWLHTTTSLLGMWSTAGEPSKAPSTLRHRLS